MKRIPAVLAIVTAAVMALVGGGVPAAAMGNWAVTYMDPPPRAFEGGKSYALGFWVLQHGSHPYEGDLGPVALRLTGEDGKSLTFDGTALPEAGHYATSVVVPAGEWKVEGIQGIFEPYEVGTLTVPGALKVNPVRPDIVMGVPADGKDYWGAVRPPGFPPGKAPATAGAATPTAAPQTQAQGQPVQGGAPAPQAEAPAGDAGRDSGGVPAYTLLIAVAGGALLAVAALRLLPALTSRGLPRRGEDEPDPPVDESADTIVSSR
ncbi:hypothetical protein [Nonomuraea jiangxiensis]|uniref:Uncharacterized protein n=1 Tax=Nonomuraea jiangxiensis TaxID=633440 RepID=A0A1G9U8L7_9ACTN|nr:hypothetical protein [Nonomuraea jiangxiensis]SDM55875.1 hypothetical protein SAMN05421869_14735 [Nonomuraea jiangxiensis]